MKLELQPYQYMQIREIIADLIHSYQSVSDVRTIQTIRAIAVEKINQTITGDYPEIDVLIKYALNDHLRHGTADKLFANLKSDVIPFVQPSKKQVGKVFHKIKKLKVPDFETIDLRECTFVGWNDLGTRRKFMLYYEDDQLRGISGDISSTVVKGFCAICHHESNVALFTAITKRGSEGQYTKKGNYICTDSMHCNQQLCSRTELDDFLDTIN